MNTPPHGARTWPILVTLWLSFFVQASQFLIVAPILPRISEAIRVPEQLLGTLISAYAAAVGIFALVAGPVSDRVGRRAILRVGTAAMAVALLLHGFADSFASLLVLRVCAGTAAGVLSVAVTAYIGDIIPYARRGAAMGWVMSGMAFGQILGIPAGTLLAGSSGFQTPFMIFGGVMVAAWVLTMTVLPVVPSQSSTPLGVRSALVGYVDLLRRRDIAAASVASVVMMLGVSLYIVYYPAWLEAELGASPGSIAVMFLFGGVANAVAGPFAGRLSDRIGRRRLVVGSSLALAPLMAVTPFIPTFRWIYPLFFLVMGVAGFRMGPLNALLTALVEGDQRGSLMSLSMATGQVGFAIGAALAGWAYVQMGYSSNALGAALGAVITAAIIAGWVAEPSGLDRSHSASVAR